LGVVWTQGSVAARSSAEVNLGKPSSREASVSSSAHEPTTDLQRSTQASHRVRYSCVRSIGTERGPDLLEAQLEALLGLTWSTLSGAFPLPLCDRRDSFRGAARWLPLKHSQPDTHLIHLREKSPRTAPSACRHSCYSSSRLGAPCLILSFQRGAASWPVRLRRRIPSQLRWVHGFTCPRNTYRWHTDYYSTAFLALLEEGLGWALAQSGLVPRGR